MKVCLKCKEEKELIQFIKSKQNKSGYRGKCKNCENEISRIWHQNNKHKIDKDKRNEYIKQYNKKRRLKDPMFKLQGNIRSLIGISIRRKTNYKKTKTENYLCCSFKEFRIHLERQFTKGMSWENIGEWHLDHIYPVSLAKDEEEIIKLNHYTNFQPLWAIDNKSKGNKIIEKQLILI